MNTVKKERLKVMTMKHRFVNQMIKILGSAEKDCVRKV